MALISFMVRYVFRYEAIGLGERCSRKVHSFRHPVVRSRISITLALNNPTMDTITPTSARPKNWLVESILVTIFCCLPFGIVGIINAANVNSKFDSGDIAGAERASADASKWTKIGFFVGLAGVVIYILMVFVFGMAGLGMGMGM